MKKLVMAAIAIVLAAGLSAAPALAETISDTATVQVTITVLPYAQITFTADTVQVTLPKDAATATCDPVAVGGTVICNCSVSLSGNVTPPADAPGIWGVAVEPTHIDNPGEYTFETLFKIVVLNNDGGFAGQVYDMVISPDFAPVGEEAVVVITAIPEPD